MRKLEVIKKIIKQICWVCDGIKCEVCNNTGYWQMYIYHHIYTDNDGKKYCISGDSLK